MDNMLKDKVAIITGSGRGIGRKAALMFAAEGAKVVVSDIDAEPAEKTVADIKAAGGEAVAFVGDAIAADFGVGIVKAAMDAWGALHIIVNNAGYTWDKMIHNMSDEMWDAMLDLHLKAPFRLIRAAAPCMREAAKQEQAQGKIVSRKIINVSSVSGTRGGAGQANYSSAKSGILGLTKTLSKEWGRFNVQSNSVAYGWIETRLTEAKESAEKLQRHDKEVQVGIPEARREALKQAHPMGRPGTSEEAASVILFLASPLSDYVSGQVIEVTGGS
ncbi:MAG: SDR family oxidoreductase [Proteobacteria bacterium]|nr:SDR family oxidoreductase [Pseudomonadota bacterium]